MESGSAAAEGTGGSYRGKHNYYNYRTTNRVRIRDQGNVGIRLMAVRFRERLRTGVSYTLKKILWSYVPVNVCHYL